MSDLEQKLKDLKVRIFDSVEAFETAVKEKEQLLEVLVKVAKAVGFDPSAEQITYDQIVDKVSVAAQALAAKTVAASDVGTASPVAQVADTSAVADASPTATEDSDSAQVAGAAVLAQ